MVAESVERQRGPGGARPPPLHRSEATCFPGAATGWPAASPGRQRAAEMNKAAAGAPKTQLPQCGAAHAAAAHRLQRGCRPLPRRTAFKHVWAAQSIHGVIQDPAVLHSTQPCASSSPGSYSPACLSRICTAAEINLNCLNLVLQRYSAAAHHSCIFFRVVSVSPGFSSHSNSPPLLSNVPFCRLCSLSVNRGPISCGHTRNRGSCEAPCSGGTLPVRTQRHGHAT